MPEEAVVEVDGVPVKVVGATDGVKVVLNRTVKDASEVRIELKKMAKGYGWEISASGPDPSQVIATLTDADTQLRQQFVSEE